jgi:PAS domain S-box-containing protein
MTDEKNPKPQAAEACEISELRLQLALEATGDGLWDWDLRNNQAYLSPSYYALSGYQPEEVTADFALFQRLIHPEDLPGVMATIEAYLRGETPISEIEYRMVTASGALRWIRGRGRVVERDAAGTPLRMVGLITDISEQKHLELALRESEARYRAVLEDQTEFIARFRTDGTVVYANEIYCRFFNKPGEEIIGHRWQPVAHPDDLSMIEARLAGLSPAQPVVVIENRIYDRKGEVRWMQFVNRAFFDAAGSITEIQVVGRDITRRKQIEAKKAVLLEENTRLTRELIDLQDKERAHLARELHDELSQQLVAIRIHAAAIRRRAAGGDAQLLADAGAIEASASHIYAASHRLMEGLHPQLLDSAGLDEALRMLLLDAWVETHRDIRATLRLAGKLDAIGDEALIHLFRITQECLSNVALHARAGQVRVFLGERWVDGQRALRLVIRDDGVGMDPAAERGGLGLRVMRERAYKLGGSFALQSRPGAGTRVAVEVRVPPAPRG